MSEIDLKYQALGGAGGLLGQPTNEECICPDAVGHFRHYQGGSIYWHPLTGAFEVHGAIRQKWSSLGWEKSFLGYPTTDESGTPDGIGRFNHFQGGSIYWTPKTDAHEVHGAIREKWASLGWERSFLNYPTSDEMAADGGRLGQFQRGTIYWSPATGAHEVHGGILAHYLSLGGYGSYLGFPTSDETPEGNARFNAFTGGWIYWTASFGSADTPYKVHGGRTYTGLEGMNLDWKELRKWTSASPTTYLFRRNVVENAFIENELGLHMPAAAARYCSGGFPEGVGGWCSELAHYILLMNKGGVHCIGAPGCGDLGDAYTVGEFKGIFAFHKLWVPHEKINGWSIEPGDYLSTQNGNHSTIVVGVKWDRSEIWTVERLHYSDDNDFVGYNSYSYMDQYGLVNDEFYGVGKLHCAIVDAAACVVQPILARGTDASGAVMGPGQVLRAGNSLTSPGGKYTLTYQTDCNLVLYRNSDRHAVWASDTYAWQPPGAVVMQTDGNLVMYDTVLNPIWATNIYHPGSHLVVQDDGNVAIYRPDNHLVWAMPANVVENSLPSGPTAKGPDMEPGEVLHPGESVTSANGQYTFTYQLDGNLVLCRNRDRHCSWATDTNGISPGVCVMQADGNLVVYSGDAKPVWDSETWQYHRSHLVVQDDGNVVIYRPDNKPAWATGTDEH